MTKTRGMGLTKYSWGIALATYQDGDPEPKHRTPGSSWGQPIKIRNDMKQSRNTSAGRIGS